MILRKDGDYFLLVGECFVFGMMRGEMLEVGLEEKEFVLA